MLCPKCFLINKKFDQNNLFPKRICWLKKKLTLNSFGPNFFWTKIFFVPKKALGQKSLDWNNFWVKKKLGKKIAPTFLDQKNIGSKKVGVKNFRFKKFRSTNSRPPKNYLVKIGSVTAKIFLIWTNVTVTAGICSIFS